MPAPTNDASALARGFVSDALLKDGGSIRIRAIRPDDKQRLLEHFTRLSPASVYQRFLGVKKTLTAEELERLTELDFEDAVGLVATLEQAASERIVGVGRYFVTERAPGRPRRAEVAFAVEDSQQGRGIGTQLLTELLPFAREHGIVEFEADVLGHNNRMLRVFSHMGFVVKRSMEGGVVHLSFPTEETEESLLVAEARERAAAAASVRGLVHPRSVAIVGASNRPGSIGGMLLAHVLEAGFKGPVYAVNPGTAAVRGQPAFPSVSAIGAAVDLAVIAVPAPQVEAVVRDCASAGVRGVVVISAGFGEASPAGQEAERRLRDLVRSSGMRMVGPNCMGLLNTDPSLSLNATFAPLPPPHGNIGMLSQSGALGVAVIDHARRRGLGLSSFVSAGNKADVSGNDLLAYWADDSATRVILLYLESFGNPRRFARIAPEVARVKPIVAVKAGRSASGARAASSHSAALASLDVAVDALFEQAGVIRTETLEDLFDVAALLSTQPLPLGARVGVVTNAGGPGILVADACEARGLALPELAPETVAALRAFLPTAAGSGNPVDMLAAAGAPEYEQAVQLVGNDPNVDSLVVVHIPLLPADGEIVAAAIGRGAGRVPSEKPVLAVLHSPTGATPHVEAGPRGRLPAYSFPENAARALAAAAQHARWRRRPRGNVLALDRTARSAVRAVVERALAGRSEPCWLSPLDVATVLRAAGIPFAEVERTTPAEAAAAAERMGFPLVVKAIAPGLVHKSDVGGVITGLRTPAEVAAAARRLGERLEAAGKALEGLLLQREVAGGIEALVGVTSDPTFGPLLVCGLGGVLAELLRDVSFLLHPVSDVDAEEMLARLRSRRLLDGWRGAPAGDKAALVRVIQSVSALVEAVPELRELDLNPVKLLPPGQGTVAVDARIRLAPAPGA